MERKIKGFSLMELMIVIAIIGILAAGGVMKLGRICTANFTLDGIGKWILTAE